jgi:hypothetical protein
MSIEQICTEHSIPDCADRVSKLIVLNEGHISDGVLRANLPIAWSVCHRLCESLIAANLAKPPEDGRILKNLPDASEGGGWLKGA